MNKIKQYITKKKQERKDKNSKYKLSGISPKKQATVIDYINEFCIGYFTEQHEIVPRLQTLDPPINKKFGLHSVATELLINIMIKEKIITPIYDESGDFINELECNSNGFELYFNGGLIKKIKRERRKATLVSLGSIASILVGLYYLVLLLRELSLALGHLF